jgi:hypothetical protein
MYRPASRETLEGRERGREASVTPPRTPNNDSGVVGSELRRVSRADGPETVIGA